MRIDLFILLILSSFAICIYGELLDQQDYHGYLPPPIDHRTSQPPINKINNEENLQEENEVVQSNYYEHVIPINLPAGYIQSVLPTANNDEYFQSAHLDKLEEQTKPNQMDRSNARTFFKHYVTKFIEKPSHKINKNKSSHKLTKTIVRSEPNLKEVESMLEEFIRNGLFSTELNHNGHELDLQHYLHHDQFLNTRNQYDYLLPLRNPKYNEIDYSDNDVPFAPITNKKPFTPSVHYNPSSFGYNNQVFHQINQSPINVNHFLFKPSTPEQNPSKILKSIPLSSKYYSNDINNREFPQLNNYHETAATIKLPQIPQIPKVTANFFAYSTPQILQNEISNDYFTSQITPHKHYNVIFIKAPEQISRRTFNIAKENLKKNEQTVIYLLSKKTGVSELQEALGNVSKERIAPKVHFIKYKTDEEALLAQQSIQAKYNSIGPNDDFLNEPIIVQPESSLKLSHVQQNNENLANEN